MGKCMRGAAPGPRKPGGGPALLFLSRWGRRASSGQKWAPSPGPVSPNLPLTHPDFRVLLEPAKPSPSPHPAQPPLLPRKKAARVTLSCPQASAHSSLLRNRLRPLHPKQQPSPSSPRGAYASLLTWLLPVESWDRDLTFLCLLNVPMFSVLGEDRPGGKAHLCLLGALWGWSWQFHL